MTMNLNIKQSFIFLGLGALVGLSIYLFFLPYAYLVKFKSEHSPLSIYSFVQQNVIETEEWQDKLHMTQVIETENEQDINLFWEIEYDGEISEIKIKIIFTENQWIEKLKILVLNADLFDSTLTRIKDIYKELNEDIESFDWATPKNGQLNGSDCLCVDLKSTFKEKPRMMNEHVDHLAYYAQNVQQSISTLIYQLNQLLRTILFIFFLFPSKSSIKTKGIARRLLLQKNNQVLVQLQLIFMVTLLQLIDIGLIFMIH